MNLSAKKISSFHRGNGGTFHLYYDCKSLNEFLELPNGIEFEGKVFKKVGFNGTFLAFYECNDFSLRSVDLNINENDLQINTGKQDKDGTFIYVKYGDMQKNKKAYLGTNAKVVKKKSSKK